MKYRRLGKTNFEVSEVSLGAWRIGGSWGSVSEQDAKRLLHAAIDQGINFIDTADVYGDGRSERLIAEVLTERRDQVYIATKAGRRLQPHAAEGYTKENLDDHRNFNRNGEQLDRGETFSGVDPGGSGGSRKDPSTAPERRIDGQFCLALDSSARGSELRYSRCPQ
jgi:Aldo/keto reductase family